MALTGKLEVEVEIKSPADKFWESIRDATTLFPKICPELYKSVEVLEGDGKSAGTVRLLTYEEVIPGIKTSKERIDFVDEASKEHDYSVVGGDMSNFFKVFKCNMQIVPKGEGSLVKWRCDYEKVSEGVPAHDFKDFAVKNFQGLDAYLLQA